MAFALSKAEEKTLADHAEQLSTMIQKMKDEQAAMNAEIAVRVAKLNEYISEYNESLDNAREFTDNKAQEWRDEWDEKSEGWQEGVAGEAAMAFIEEWENIDIADDMVLIEFEGMNNFDLDDIDHAAELLALKKTSKEV